MRFRILCLSFFISVAAIDVAGKSPVELKYDVWGIHALRYYPFTQSADSIIGQMIANNAPRLDADKTCLYKKTSVDLVLNKQYLDEQINPPTIVYKYLMKPYISWLDYAQPADEQSQDPALTIFLSEELKTENQTVKTTSNGLFEFIEPQNIRDFLNEWIGNIDISKEKNEILSKSIKGPFSEDASKIYKFFFSSKTRIDEIPVYEIAFFSKRLKEDAFEGYLYISEKDLSLVKAVFTLNFQMNIGRAKNILFIQTPSESQNSLYLGDDTRAGLLIMQSSISKEDSVQIMSPQPITAQSDKIQKLIAKANHTPAYKNTEKAIFLGLTNSIRIAGNKMELGHVSQMIHYNEMEGLRLRISGNTTYTLNKQFSGGGYLAYGIKDKILKYRGDIVYSRHPENSWHLTYIKDLNIPGYDLIDDKRDHFFYSFSHSRTDNMSLQKIGLLSYENSFFNRFSLKISAKYWFDQPAGQVKYITKTDEIQTINNDITNTELGFSIRYAPNEKYLPLQNQRIVFRQADWDLKLNHRIGIKGILNSNYNYQISDFSLYKRLNFPQNIGSLGIRISGGKVWNRVPFPLLFIPAGNQSYIFDSNDYNLMNFYEFITDQFVGENANIQFNWSPLKLIFPKNKICTNLGIKTFYGPLSDNNNPAFHPELFIFNNGAEALGNSPYKEANIGLGNIFNFLRVDYVHRLGNKSKGAIFFSTSLDF